MQDCWMLLRVDLYGVFATITLYVTDGSGGRAVRQTWCVSDPNAWVRSCLIREAASATSCGTMAPTGIDLSEPPPA